MDSLIEMRDRLMLIYSTKSEERERECVTSKALKLIISIML